MSLYNVDGRVIAYTAGGPMTGVSGGGGGSGGGLTPVALSSKLIVTGHSIPYNCFNAEWTRVIIDSGATPDVKTQLGAYSSAVARWVNDYAGPDQVRALMQAPGASYDIFVGTEAHGGGYTGQLPGMGSSVLAHIEWSEGYSYALQYHNLASSTGARTFYANFWRTDPTEVFGAAWRADQNNEVAPWNGIIDHVNANRAGGTQEMRLIPWLQVFMAVYDAVQAGTVTGLDFGGMFYDDVHAETSEAKWMQMATVMAVVYQRHPDQLSHTWSQEYGGPRSISPALAAQLRPIIWSTCVNTPRTGLAP